MNSYSFEVKKILKSAENISRNLHHTYIGTEHLFLSLYNDKQISNLLNSYNISYDLFLNDLNTLKEVKNKVTNIYTPLLKRVIKESLEENKKIKPLDLLKSMLELDEGIAVKILISEDVNLDKLYEDIKKSKQSYQPKLELLKYGKLMNNYVDNNRCINREKEIETIIEILLRKNKNNPLLIGEAGVGKTAIIEELVRRINKNLVPKALQNKRIISLETSTLVAGTKYRGEFEEKLNKIIKEIENNPDIILFIDEIHTISNAGGAEGAINASDILKPYLARGSVKIIGATTYQEYQKYIKKDKALMRRFETININEPSKKETFDILYKIKDIYEKHYNIKISKENIDYITNLSLKIYDRFNPDKSLDLLDSVCSRKIVVNQKIKQLNNLQNKIDKLTKEKEGLVKENNFKLAYNKSLEIINLNKKINSLNNKHKRISKNDIEEVFKRRCNIKEPNLLNLNSYLKSKIINQDIQIDSIVNTLNKKNKNLTLSMLLIGQSGIGKSYLVENVASYLNMPLLKIDMNTFNNSSDITRLIGFPSNEEECIFSSILKNPSSIILVKDIDKAHLNIINLFMQILDEGFLTLANKEKVNFTNTYIFFTSKINNQGNIGFLNNQQYFKDINNDLLNKVDKVIKYNNLNKEMLLDYLKNNHLDIDIKDYDYALGYKIAKKYLKLNA